jgi:hypothetical protein
MSPRQPLGFAFGPVRIFAAGELQRVPSPPIRGRPLHLQIDGCMPRKGSDAHKHPVLYGVPNASLSVMGNGVGQIEGYASFNPQEDRAFRLKKTNLA